MKLIIIKTFVALSILSLTSCASTKYFSIDVMQPAKVTFSKDIANIAIVDNAGAEIINDEIAISREALTSMCKSTYKESLAQFMNEEKYFNQVVLHPAAMREDQDYGTQKLLGKQQIQEIAMANDANAVITIDLFETFENSIAQSMGGFFYYVQEARANAALKIYNSRGDAMSPTILVGDSIIWGEGENNVLAYRDLALQLSELTSKLLIPHWQPQERWYYTDGTKLMKEANNYVKTGNWVEAAKTWGVAFENENDNKQKAKIASNIAIANESLDDIENALKWIRIASNHIVEHKRSVEFTEINWYKVRLLERQRDTPDVLQQMGVEEE